MRKLDTDRSSQRMNEVDLSLERFNLAVLPEALILSAYKASRSGHAEISGRGGNIDSLRPLARSCLQEQQP